MATLATFIFRKNSIPIIAKVQPRNTSAISDETADCPSKSGSRSNAHSHTMDRQDSFLSQSGSKDEKRHVALNFLPSRCLLFLTLLCPNKNGMRYTRTQGKKSKFGYLLARLETFSWARMIYENLQNCSVHGASWHMTERSVVIVQYLHPHAWNWMSEVRTSDPIPGHLIRHLVMITSGMLSAIWKKNVIIHGNINWPALEDGLRGSHLF